MQYGATELVVIGRGLTPPQWSLGFGDRCTGGVGSGKCAREQLSPLGLSAGHSGQFVICPYGAPRTSDVEADIRDEPGKFNRISYSTQQPLSSERLAWRGLVPRASADVEHFRSLCYHHGETLVDCSARKVPADITLSSCRQRGRIALAGQCGWPLGSRFEGLARGLPKPATAIWRG